MSLSQTIFGDAEHFRLRQASWYMAGVNFLVGIAMIINPDMMTDNPGANLYFSNILRWITQEELRNLFLIIGSVRLVALVVNGKFPLIWFTPHVRTINAFVSFGIWVQFELSLIISGTTSIGTVVYGSYAAIELYNIKISSTEAWVNNRCIVG